MVDLVSDKAEYLAEEIAKQIIEGEAWLLLNAYSKMWEDRNDLKMRLLLIKKEAKLRKLGNS